ncbi:MAG: DNA polymerase III subunit beta [Actinomycetota bacterium]|nr:DNA polymerase III subunit beta [Actinomycetota bacterium]
MKITVKAKDLAPGLSLATRAVSTRSTIALLSGVLIEAAGKSGSVTLSATDMETSVRVPVPEASADKTGSVVAPARLLSDVVRSLPEEATLTIEHEEKAGSINLSAETPSKGGGSSTASYAVRCFASSDFPKLPAFSEEGAMTVPAAVFAYLAEKTTKVASKDATRPVLAAVLVESYEDALRAVSTDSYRLCVAEAHAEGAKGAEGAEDGARTALVTANALREVARLAKAAGDDKKNQVAVSLSESHACFRVGGAFIAGRLVEGNFPNYARLLPESFSGELIVERVVLEDALSRVRPFAGAPGERASTPIVLSYSPPSVSGTLGDALDLHAESSEIGTARERVPVVGAKGTCAEVGIEVSFKPDYLADGLRLHADSKEVVLKVNEPLKPAILAPGSGGDGSRRTFYLIMPMRNPNVSSTERPAPKEEPAAEERTGREEPPAGEPSETPAGKPVGQPVS